MKQSPPYSETTNAPPAVADADAADRWRSAAGVLHAVVVEGLEEDREVQDVSWYRPASQPWATQVQEVHLGVATRVQVARAVVVVEAG